jgi:methionyl-tRNA formyltransferase
MPTTRPRAILLTSNHEHLATAAEEFARRHFEVVHVSGYPRSANLLRSIRRAAINFHPAPPAYPGVGSASYALFHGDSEFGITAHLMEPKCDSGLILQTLRFPVAADDTCESLFDRALVRSLDLYQEVLAKIAAGRSLEGCGETWARAAITRAEFERWMELSLDDPPDVFERKINALRHSRFPGPYLQVRGRRFAYVGEPDRS